jgi:hypothetical protein
MLRWKSVDSKGDDENPQKSADSTLIALADCGIQN